MTNEVSFPGLGLEFTVNPVAFTVFGLDVMWYGVVITLGIILAVAFAMTQAQSFGIDKDRMLDVVIAGVICGVLGARVYYIVFIDDMNFANFFNFRGGGLAIYGGIIGAAIAVVVFAPLRKVPVLPLMDLTGMGFLVGQGLGRWGNFTNQEAFGTNTTAPWGMISPQTTRYLQYRQAALAAEGVVVDPLAPVHPTFLYESLWCLVGFLGLFLYRKRRRFNGEIALLYAIWYGAGRFWIEGLRTDSLYVGDTGVRVSQLLAAVCVLAGLAVWVMARVKTRGKPLRVPAIPDRTAKVKLDGELVEIRWPGGRELKESEKLALAREAVAAREAESVETGAGKAEVTVATAGEEPAKTEDTEAGGEQTPIAEVAEAETGGDGEESPAAVEKGIKKDGKNEEQQADKGEE